MGGWWEASKQKYQGHFSVTKTYLTPKLFLQERQQRRGHLRGHLLLACLLSWVVWVDVVRVMMVPREGSH